MTKNIVQKIQSKAQELYEIRKKIVEIEEQHKQDLKGLKIQRDLLQSELIDQMTDTGLKSLKVESGDTFSVGTRKGIAVTSEPHALKWAMDNRCVSINKTLLAQKLKEVEEMPSFFQGS